MTGLTDEQVEAACIRYAPILKFHPSEQYNMCVVEYFLSNSTLHDSQTKQDLVHPTVDQLPTGPASGDRYSFTLDSGKAVGELSTAVAYVHAYWDQSKNYTDLQFWFFYAYNGPATAHTNSLVFDTIVKTKNTTLAPLGEHTGDWECCILRIDNDSQALIGVYLTQHSGGTYFPENQLGAFARVGDQIVIYSSLNGHALYPGAGSNYSEKVKDPPSGWPMGIEFFLRNDTADGGASLDCAANFQLISADWLNVPEPNWVNYQYRWGTVGDVNRITPSAVMGIISGLFGDLATAASLSYIVAPILLAILVKESADGPTSPITKDTWISGGFPSSDTSNAVAVSSPVLAPASTKALLLQMNVDGQLRSPLATADNGWPPTAAIVAVTAPIVWDLTVVDPEDVSKGMIISNQGLYLTSTTVNIPEEGEALAYSANSADATPLMPTPTGGDDAAFFLQRVSDGQLLTVDTMGFGIVFRPQQPSDSDPFHQHWVFAEN